MGKHLPKTPSDSALLQASAAVKSYDAKGFEAAKILVGRDLARALLIRALYARFTTEREHRNKTNVQIRELVTDKLEHIDPCRVTPRQRERSILSALAMTL